MKIKKLQKIEKTKRNRTLFIGIVIMFLMPYMVVLLNDEGVFKGWEFMFAISYAAAVDLLLLGYIVKSFADLKLEFYISSRKLKVRDGFFRFHYSVPLERIAYVDVLEKKNSDYEIFILMNNGKSNKNFENFNIQYVKLHPEFKKLYDYLLEKNKMVDFLSCFIKRGGVKKYYLLYLIFKNSYNAEFSKSALEHVKRFMEEYNMS